MPLITAKRSSPCAACGGTVQKEEQAWYTQEGGLRHVEPTCRLGPVRFRPNLRPGTCRCGARVAARAGLLTHAGASGTSSGWQVRCSPPGPRC
jgi:hypothetical protein